MQSTVIEFDLENKAFRICKALLIRANAYAKATYLSQRV